MSGSSLRATSGVALTLAAAARLVADMGAVRMSSRLGPVRRPRNGRWGLGDMWLLITPDAARRAVPCA